MSPIRGHCVFLGDRPQKDKKINAKFETPQGLPSWGLAGPEIADFGGSKRPRLPRNPLEKVDRGLAGPENDDFSVLNGPLLPQNPLEFWGCLFEVWPGRKTTISVF